MNSRTAPLTLVAFLALLTVGFAVIGLAMAPNSADLAVHNGTGETFAAPQFTIELTQSTTAAQTSVQVVDYHAPDQMLIFQGTTSTKLRLTETPPPDTIPSLLAHFNTFTAGSTNWVRKGSLFDRIMPVGVNVQHAGQSAVVAGTLREIAVIRGGYLVALDQVVEVPQPSRTGAKGTYAVAASSSIRLLKLNGGPPPAVGSIAN